VTRPHAKVDTRVTWAIFAGVAALLLAIHGQRMVLTNDEGIVLDAAQRIAAGQRPYVDFATYMSPGSYWLQAIVFQWFGLALWTGRLIVILDFSLQCALVYWLVARLSSRAAAVAALVAFAGFQIADPALLTAQHRWDSATLALAGLCLAVAADGRKGRWLASGGLLAAAAWCTPSMLLAGVAIGGWLLISSQRRRNLVPFVAGVAGLTLAALVTLAATGSLAAFFHQMFWLRQNYSALNTMPYGSIIGGYRALIEGANGFLDIAVRVLLVACVALPAILPIAAILLWGALLWRGKVPAEQRPVIGLLLLAAGVFVITTLPRADVMHLAFVAALPYALAAAAFARLLPSRARAALAMGSSLLAILFASNYAKGWNQTVPMQTPVGILRVPVDQASEFGRLLATVHPGESLFVYPYMPVQYFFTQGKNPTRYCGLGPGMTTPEQESEGLAELQARPPEWLLYMQLSREEFLRVFPNGTDLNFRLENLEAWMERNYRPVEGPSVNVGGYRLWRREPAPEAAALQR
jgi:4-amino-4-deoxy-L-arabinose transferase-like glycosyltransferase